MPASPVATLRSQSHSRSNDSLNAAQCSRSTPRRSRSREPRGDLAPAPVADRLVPRLEVVDPVRHEDGQRARDHEVVERAARVVDDPVPLLLVDHLAAAVGEHARGARVEDEEPRVAEVAVVGPAARGRLAVPLAGGLAEARARRRRRA